VHLLVLFILTCYDARSYEHKKINSSTNFTYFQSTFHTNTDVHFLRITHKGSKQVKSSCALIVQTWIYSESVGNFLNYILQVSNKYTLKITFTNTVVLWDLNIY